MYLYESTTTVAKNLLYKVYALMASALLVTALVAWYVVHQPGIMEKLLTNTWLVFGLFLGQLILVIILSAAVMRLSFPTALMLLFAYALLMGVTFSTIFLLYTQQSIYTAFFVTSGMFASLAIYGYFTQTDLSKVGSYAIMALFGLILCFIINIFLQNGTFDYIASLIGVVIFSALTAYDVQKIKQLSVAFQNQKDVENKIAILGALTLYLDFINLFLLILRLGGRRTQE